MVYAQVDVWGKGHRVTRASEEFQRLAPPKRTLEPSPLETRVDRYQNWPALLASLYKGAPRSLPEQFCVLVTEHEAAVAVPHASRDAHNRDSVVVIVAYVEVDWKSHDVLVDSICRAHALCVRLGAEWARSIAGENQSITESLRKGTFLVDGGYELSLERPEDQAFWEDLMAGVARFRGVAGVATPRMFSFGANVIVGTRAEAERAGAEGFFDQRAMQITSIGKRLVTWQPEESKGSSVAARRQPEDPDVLTHVLEVRDRLERVEASVERVTAKIEERAATGRGAESGMGEIREVVEATSRRVEARIEAMDRRAEQSHRQLYVIAVRVLDAVGTLYRVTKRIVYPWDERP